MWWFCRRIRWSISIAGCPNRSIYLTTIWIFPNWSRALSTVIILRIISAWFRLFIRRRSTSLSFRTIPMVEWRCRRWCERRWRNFLTLTWFWWTDGDIQSTRLSRNWEICRKIQWLWWEPGGWIWTRGISCGMLHMRWWKRLLPSRLLHHHRWAWDIGQSAACCPITGKWVEKWLWNPSVWIIRRIVR